MKDLVIASHILQFKNCCQIYLISKCLCNEIYTDTDHTVQTKILLSMCYIYIKRIYKEKLNLQLKVYI